MQALLLVLTFLTELFRFLNKKRRNLRRRVRTPRR